MSRTFSLLTFFRQVPHSLLKRLFHSLDIDTQEIPWEMMKNREIEPFLHLFDLLPLKQQNRLEGICHDVYELSCSSGMNALCQMADDHHESDWFKLSPEKTTLYAKSLWSWLHYPTIFQKALEYHKIDHLSLWRKRDGLPHHAPTWNHDVKKTLELALQEYLTAKQGRGQVCTVQMQNYRENVYHFLAYPDDYVRNFTHHDESGHLISRKTRPTFGIVYVYDSGEGTLELHAKGGDKIKTALEEIFLETMFGKVDSFSEKIYDLSVFKRDVFLLTADPVDNVVIQLKEITLFWRGKQAITLKTKQFESSLAWIRRSISEKALPWHDAEVTRAKIQILLLPDERRRRGSLTFEIAAPDKCSLRNQDAVRIELARKYLKLWGVEHDKISARKVA